MHGHTVLLQAGSASKKILSALIFCLLASVVLNAIKKFPYERRIKTSAPNVVDSLVLVEIMR